MTSNERGSSRILGSLRAADGTGIVRIEDRFDTDIEDLWSALTDPDRLARWVGEVAGDLQLGGEFRARFFDGWEGTGRVDVCEPPQHLLVLTKDEPDEPYHHPIEVTLTSNGNQTLVIWEERNIPLDHLAAYGAGIQIHVEDLADYLAGRAHRDVEVRWGELEPLYRDLEVS